MVYFVCILRVQMFGERKYIATTLKKILSFLRMNLDGTLLRILFHLSGLNYMSHTSRAEGGHHTRNRGILNMAELNAIKGFGLRRRSTSLHGCRVRTSEERAS